MGNRLYLSFYLGGIFKSFYWYIEMIIIFGGNYCVVFCFLEWDMGYVGLSVGVA